MSDVTQADRQMAYHVFCHVGLMESAAKALRGDMDDNPIVKYAAAHRIAAEKAVLDRLRQPESLERIAQAIGRETVKRNDRGILFDDLPDDDKAVVLEIIDIALADALETKR